MRKNSEVQSVVYPITRFEYFVGIALQGLITGKSEKDLRRVPDRAIELAKELEKSLDS